jgi:succinylglutamate desuccinylase
MISALVHGNELCGAWALKGLLEAACARSRAADAGVLQPGSVRPL